MGLGKFQLRELDHRELQSNRTGEKYSFTGDLTALFGFRDLFVHEELIPPGRRSSGTHFHSRREELVLVLEGTVVAFRNGERVELNAGDFTGFPPGKEHAHHLANESDAPARVLVIASNPPGDAVEFVR